MPLCLRHGDAGYMIEDRKENRVMTERERIMIGAAVLAVALMCFYVFVYQQKKEQCTTLQERIRSADLEAERILRAIPDLKKLEKEVARGRKWVSLAKKAASDMQPMQQVLQQLAGDARRLDIEVISMKLKEGPEQSYERPGYKKVTMVVNIQCSYRHLGSYLESLGDLPGLFILEGIEIARDSRIYPRLQAKLTLSAFVSGERV